MHLFVAGLPYDLDDAELLEFFEKFGEVISAKVALDKETGKSRGFGFVEMLNDEDGKEAIEGLNELYLGKKQLVVKQAEDRGNNTRSSSSHRGGNSGGFRGGNNNSRGGYGGGGYNNNRGNRDRNRF